MSRESSEPKEPPLEAHEEQESDPMHPDAKRLFHAIPWSRSIPIFGEACQAYGPKCTMSLATCYLLSKGIADQGLQAANFAMFRTRYGLDATRYQRLSNIAKMGWSIKALTAMLCDSFAFFGYTKRWYMMISCFAGAAFALVYGLLPAKESSANIAAACVFLTAYGKANVDILSEGHYSRLMRKIPKAGPSLISWIWIFIMIGAIIAVLYQGPLSDAHLQQVGVFIAAFLQFITGFIFLFNWYGEKRNREDRADDSRILHDELKAEQLRLRGEVVVEDDTHLTSRENSSKKDDDDDDAHGDDYLHDHLDVLHGDTLGMHEPTKVMSYDLDEIVEPEFMADEPVPCCCGVIEFNKEVVMRSPRILIYSVVMTCAVLTMTLGVILANTLGLAIICGIVSVVCCGMSFWALPKVIAKANVFNFIQMMLYLQVAGATDSFYMADPECSPDGPHFSFTFYNTVAAAIGNVAGLGGVACFNYIFSKRGYHITVVVTTVVYIIASAFDIIMLKRWNVAIGIPDHAMYICGDAVVYQACYMLNWMPMVVLLSRLCPRGSESVVYAIMAGFSNLGQATSSAIGSILMEYVWPVDTVSTPCNFSNVPWLILVGHVLLPLINIPMAYLLLPSARICDNVDVDGNAIREEAKRTVDAQQRATAEPSVNSEAHNGR